MSVVLDRPRLRPGLAAGPDPDDPTRFVLWDKNRLTHTIVRVNRHELEWANLFDGRSDVQALQRRATLQNGGDMVSTDAIAALADRLDEALLLDSPRFRGYVTGPIRMPSCIGCYSAEPAELRKQLATVFTAPGGPGLPAGAPPAVGSLRAVLVPHMDYGRGGVTYGWGFRELFDNTAARLFVIIGTSHYSPERFTLSRQNFQTPLGVAPTDQDFVERLANHYGEGLFDDPFAHLPEHSIELEVVLLQYLYEQRRSFRIVPLLVGSFADAVEKGDTPAALEDVARMVTALQQAEAETDEEICFVISGDLAHIGPKFGDSRAVSAEQLAHGRRRDDAILAAARSADPDAYFRVIAGEANARRICGLPPTWVTLAAAAPSRGRPLHYGRYVHPHGFESVSFAAAAFDR